MNMLLDAIRTELGRLQVHAVNLAVETDAEGDDQLVALHGSLLQYWKLPTAIDGNWLLAELQGLPDAAGPQAVMNGVAAAHAAEVIAATAGAERTQLRLFDPQSQGAGQGPAVDSAAARKDS
jgi:hypothetical protein